MKRTIIILTLAVLAALVPVAPVSASPTFPTERPTRSALVLSAARSATAFWAARGVTVADDPQFFVVDDVADLAGPDAVTASARADCPGDRVWIARQYITDAEHELRLALRHPRWRFGNSDRQVLWTIVAHELGHTAGLDHSDGGLMAAEPGIGWWQARHWARAVSRPSAKGVSR